MAVMEQARKSVARVAAYLIVLTSRACSSRISHNSSDYLDRNGNTIFFKSLILVVPRRIVPAQRGESVLSV
jgi:hypothetical protein